MARKALIYSPIKNEMKKKVKALVNKIMIRLFGHRPFPPQRGEGLKFVKIEFPVRNLSCREFNEISRNIYNLSLNY